MKQRLLVAVLTVIVFAAGFVARMLTEAGPSVPPPPAPGAEFVRSSAATPTADMKERRAPTYTEKDRTKLVHQIEEIRPQIDAYRQRIDEIAADFERDFVPILNPAQRAKFDAAKKREQEKHAKGDRKVAETVTLSDEQIFQFQQRPLWNALWNVAINWRLQRLARDYKLDEQQQEKVRQLLLARRQKFLDLVDSSPPPSITLSQLATQAEKLAPAKK
ncbi:MAG TPA: hypothetical protein VHE61_13690 [Opitutaceae bacterium]|nr:hypothetical protein [Opitutaceae bacterium]